MASERPSVMILYNHVGEDEYEKLRDVDPASLDFDPAYDIHVSTISEEYAEVARALRKEGFHVRQVNVREDLKRLQSVLRRKPPDVVFNLIEFFHDESGFEPYIAGLFELEKVAYTGAPPFSLSLCQRKGLAKQVLLANGVPTPLFMTLSTPKVPRAHGLRYPLMVKPAREDASSGVNKDSVVRTYPALRKRVRKLLEDYRPPVLVEEFIEGRELHVSVLGNNPPVVLPAIEFDFSELPEEHPHVISYDAKWNPLDIAFHSIHSHCPAKLTRPLWKKIQDVSLNAFKVMKCRDYARLDIRVNKRNEVFVLEVNPNPDLTEGVSFMESAEEAGLSFSETLAKIVGYALERRHPK